MALLGGMALLEEGHHCGGMGNFRSDMLNPPLTLADLPHPSFLPGDLTGQLLDPVEKCVCCSPVQRLWTKQGHTPAGRATSGPLPEGKNNSQEQ